MTYANSSLLMSLDDMGVPGRDSVRLWCLVPGVCPPNPVFSGLRNDEVLEMGGVAGISPVTLARASTPRESIFMAVSGSKLSASHSLFVVSGEGMPATWTFWSWGTRPASCEGLGAEGGEVIGDEGGSAMMWYGQIVGAGLVVVGVMYEPCTGKAVTTALQHDRWTCDGAESSEGRLEGAVHCEVNVQLSDETGVHSNEAEEVGISCWSCGVVA